VHWSRTERRCSRFDLARLISLATIHVIGPHFALSNHLLVLDIVLVDKVVITAGDESSFIFDNLETPSLTIEVRSINNSSVGTVDVDGLNLTIIMSDNDLTIENIDSRGKVILFKSNLSQELIFTLIA